MVKETNSRDFVSINSVVWALRGCTALAFLALGTGHIAALPKFVAIYDKLGADQSLRVLAGIVYLIGSGALLFRRAYLASAKLLATIMGGVAIADIWFLHANPWPAILLVSFCLAIWRLGIVDHPAIGPTRPQMPRC